MKTISKEMLRNTLSELRGSTFCTLHTITDPKCLKKHRDTKEPLPYKEVKKTSVINGTINFKYENSVNNQRKREGEVTGFIAEPRKWGNRITTVDGKVTPLVEHNGKYYVEVKPEHTKDVKYFADGKETDIDPGFLPVKSKSTRQETEKEIVVRDFALDSIQLITLKGETYRVV